MVLHSDSFLALASCSAASAAALSASSCCWTALTFSATHRTKPLPALAAAYIARPVRCFLPSKSSYDDICCTCLLVSCQRIGYRPCRGGTALVGQVEDFQCLFVLQPLLDCCCVNAFVRVHGQANGSPPAASVHRNKTRVS